MADPRLRREIFDGLREVIAGLLKDRSRYELFDKGQVAGLPCAPVNDPGQISSVTSNRSPGGSSPPWATSGESRVTIPWRWCHSSPPMVRLRRPRPVIWASTTVRCTSKGSVSPTNRSMRGGGAALPDSPGLLSGVACAQLRHVHRRQHRRHPHGRSRVPRSSRWKRGTGPTCSACPPTPLAKPSPSPPACPTPSMQASLTRGLLNISFDLAKDDGTSAVPPIGGGLGRGDRELRVSGSGALGLRVRRPAGPQAQPRHVVTVGIRKRRAAGELSGLRGDGRLLSGLGLGMGLRAWHAERLHRWCHRCIGRRWPRWDRRGATAHPHTSTSPRSTPCRRCWPSSTRRRSTLVSTPSRVLNRSRGSWLCGVFRSRGHDQWLAVDIEDGSDWENLCALLERPDLRAADRDYGRRAREAIAGSAGRVDVAMQRAHRNAPSAAGRARCRRGAGHGGSLAGPAVPRARGLFDEVWQQDLGGVTYTGSAQRWTKSPGGVPVVAGPPGRAHEGRPAAVARRAGRRARFLGGLGAIFSAD